MGWDDSDDDEEIDVDAAMAAHEEAKRKAEQSEDSDSEPEVQEAPKPKPKPKPQAKKADYDVALEDAQAEKLRRRKKEEERDAKLADDLFAGCDRADEEAKAEADKKKEEEDAKKKAKKPDIIYIDSFEKREFKVQADIEKLTSEILAKFEKGKAKGGAALFLTNMVKGLESSLTTSELDTFVKALAAIEKAKKVDKTTSTAEKKKGNEKLNKNTKFNTQDELNVMYGGGTEDWDDWDEDWDDWTEKK